LQAYLRRPLNVENLKVSRWHPLRDTYSTPLRSVGIESEAMADFSAIRLRGQRSMGTPRPSRRMNVALKLLLCPK
jgi:hypothetical protein